MNSCDSIGQIIDVALVSLEHTMCKLQGGSVSCSSNDRRDEPRSILNVQQRPKKYLKEIFKARHNTQVQVPAGGLRKKVIKTLANSDSGRGKSNSG